MATRVQIDFSDERVADLERLQKVLDLSTRKELFNHALGLLEWAVRQREFGRVLMAKDEGSRSVVELTHPALDRIKPVIALDDVARLRAAS